MADNEPRKRRKKKSHVKNEPDKNSKEILKETKKSNKNVKFHHNEEAIENTSKSGLCVKCLFFSIITILVVGLGLVVSTLQASDSPAMFSEEVMEKIQTFIKDIKPDVSPANVELDPVITESQTWQDGNKINSDILEDKLVNEDELQETYGIHVGHHSSSPIDDFLSDTFPPQGEDADEEMPLVENEVSEGVGQSTGDAVPDLSGQPGVEETVVVDTPTVDTNTEDIQTVETNEKIVDTEPEDVLNANDQYQKMDVTNQYDFLIKDQLDEAESVLQHSPDQALGLFRKIQKDYETSVRAVYGQAAAYDQLASIHRSNSLLDDAIFKYVEVLSMPNVPENLYASSADRAANRSIFRGSYSKAINIQKQLINHQPRNISAQNKLAVMYMMTGQNDDATKVLKKVLKMNPSSGFAKVHLGFIAKTYHMDLETGSRLLAEGIASREPGTIDGRFYYHLGDAYHRLGFLHKAKQIHEDGAKEGVFISATQRSLYNVDQLESRPWWDFTNTKYAQSIQILKDNWLKIKDEGLHLLNVKNNFAPENEGLQDGGNWQQYELYSRGRMNVKNCNRAPNTCNIIAKLPDASRCTRCQTKFSIMYPDTHVWPHTGPTNCRLRAHLGLVVPEGPRIRVANRTREWAEGEVIVFDDSFEHEVWHTGKTFRLVLIVDFWHPDLTPHQKSTLSPI